MRFPRVGIVWLGLSILALTPGCTYSPATASGVPDPPTASVPPQVPPLAPKDARTHRPSAVPRLPAPQHRTGTRLR